MTNLNQIVIKIIKEQERIIGPIAWSEAKKVAGLEVIDQKTGQVDIVGTNALEVIDQLVAQYEKLFGRASHEVCREAVSGLIGSLSPNEIPISLR